MKKVNKSQWGNEKSGKNMLESQKEYYGNEIFIPKERFICLFFLRNVAL